MLLLDATREVQVRKIELSQLSTQVEREKKQKVENKKVFIQNLVCNWLKSLVKRSTIQRKGAKKR